MVPVQKHRVVDILFLIQKGVSFSKIKEIKVLRGGVYL